LDTNAIIALLQGNQQLIELLQDAEWIGISIISQIEFLVFPGLNEADRQLFNEFLQRVEIIWIELSQPELIELTIQLRQQYRLRLPDALIGATAIYLSATLVTADAQLQNISALDTLGFE
jgi:hypothetical protein